MRFWPKPCSRETRSPAEEEVAGAIQEVRGDGPWIRRQRELRGLIAEAERRGEIADLAVLTEQKLADSTEPSASCTTDAPTEH